jgi:putative transposase
MQITRGYRSELDLNKQQITLCKQHAGAARYAWNWGLRRKQEVYQTQGRSISAMELHRELNQLKQTELCWMYGVSKCAPQEALRDLDKGFKQFFDRHRKKKAGKWKGKVGYPRLKSKKKGLGSFRLTGSIHVTERTIQLPRLGTLRLKEHGKHAHLPVDGTEGIHILSATVSEEAGRWFVSLQVRQELPDPVPATGEPLGIDLGINALAMCSDGTAIKNPKALRSNLKRLKRLHRRLSRKQKGSRNREKARRRLARKSAHVAHIRRETLHQATSTILAKTKRAQCGGWPRPRMIVLEDLNVEGMKHNHHLALSISDVGMAEFRRQIEYKAAWTGVSILVADRWFPSTKTCSQCGHVKAKMDLSERIYVCDEPECDLVLDRDLNAARALVKLAL